MDIHRRSIRLRKYDYSANGYYFVTICSQNREEIFGEIVGARFIAPKMKLNKNGKIIQKVWLSLPDHHPVILDEFCIMPNHIHLILIINCRGAIYRAQNETVDNISIKQGLINQTPTLGKIIRYFKAKCSYEINRLNQASKSKIFQKNYFEHIIRNEIELEKIRRYIRFNPAMWFRDRNNLKNFKVIQRQARN